MNNFKSFFVVFAVILLSLPALLSLGIRYLPVNNQPPLGQTRKIYEDQAVRGGLTMPDDYFNGIGFSFKNPNLINKEEIVMQLSTENGDLVRTVVLSGRSVPDGGFVRFMFDPIAGSDGAFYVYELFSPSSGEGEALEVLLSKDSDDVALVAYYKPSSIPSLIANIYASWIERFFADKTFAVFYLGLIVLGIGYVAFGKKETT